MPALALFFFGACIHVLSSLVAFWVPQRGGEGGSMHTSRLLCLHPRCVGCLFSPNHLGLQCGSWWQPGTHASSCANPGVTTDVLWPVWGWGSPPAPKESQPLLQVSNPLGLIEQSSQAWLESLWSNARWPRAVLCCVHSAPLAKALTKLGERKISL